MTNPLAAPADTVSPAPSIAAASPAEQRLEQAVAPGWTQASAWMVAADVQSNVSVTPDYVAYLNRDGILIVLDAATGEAVFSSTPTGADPNQARVAQPQVAGKTKIAVLQSGSVLLWDPVTKRAEPKVNTVPTSAVLATSGGGLLVTSNGETWTATPDLGLVQVTGLPAGTTLSILGDGQVVSGSPAGGWSITSDGKTAPVSPQLAPGAIGQHMYPAWSSRGLVVAWAPTADDKVRSVGLYEAVTGKLLTSTQMPTSEVNAGLPLSVTVDQRLASVGKWLVDLHSGKSEMMDGWTTSTSSSGALVGKIGDAAKVWSGVGTLADVPQGAAVPWGVTAKGDGVVVADTPSGRVLAAVSPSK